MSRTALLLLLLTLLLPALAAADEVEDLKVTHSFSVGPMRLGTQYGVPLDVYWDPVGRKLYARSLILAEVGDAVDLRIRRAHGAPDATPMTR